MGRLSKMISMCAGMVFQVTIAGVSAPATPQVFYAKVPAIVGKYASKPVDEEGRPLTERKDCALYILIDGDERPFVIVYPQSGR